jgi:hypothetical protein
VPGSSNEIRTAAALVRLSTGSHEAAWSSVSWRDLASLAARERCLALAWLRSHEIIARYADPEVAGWWRDLALRALARGHAHVATLATLANALARLDVPCVVLKGVPLSASLYGEPGARASADLDLWIASRNRIQSREALLGSGWQLADGGMPGDEAFTRPGPHGDYYLEVHSSLLHSRLDYLSLPEPASTAVRIGGAVLPMMTGPLVPAYLAVHIAKHRFAPALWLIDHWTLWNRLDDDARMLARWTARRCGLDRYLEWALHRTEMLGRLREGDGSTLGHLGLQPQRREAHPMWRHVRLAPSVRSAARALLAWLAPAWARSGGLGPTRFAGRFRRYWRAALVSSPDRDRSGSGRSIATREVRLAGEQMLRVVREVTLMGGRAWITTTGTSMYPTLLESDGVLLEQAERLAIGDVVLVDSDGTAILHRVVDVYGEFITTRGDSRMTSDATVRRGDVVARAVRARRGALEWSLKPTGWRRLRLRASSARRMQLVAGGSRAHA